MTSGTAGRLCSAALILLATYAGVVACSKDEPTYVDEPVDASVDSRPSPDSGLGILTFMPRELYSGYDGTHTFAVPIAVYDSGDDLVVTSNDPSAAQITPKKLANATHDDGTTDRGKYFFVTVDKAQTITLVASSKGKSVEAKINVTTYGTDRWEAGATRYKNGGSGNPPCADCHVNGQAVDHSPAALATVTDEAIAVVITTGISTSGFPIQVNGAPGHTWTVTDTELAGLVTYLRSLTPRGFQ